MVLIWIVLLMCFTPLRETIDSCQATVIKVGQSLADDFDLYQGSDLLGFNQYASKEIAKHLLWK